MPLPSEEGDPGWRGVSEVAAHVYVGAQLGTRYLDDAHIAMDAEFLRGRGIRAILDMRQEGRDEGAVLERVGLAYLHVRVQDHYAPTVGQLDAGARFMETWTGRNDNVYVHCHAGRARSATAVIAYLMRRGQSLGEALARVEGGRTISVRWNHADLESLREYAAHLGRPELGTPDDRLPPHAA